MMSDESNDVAISCPVCGMGLGIGSLVEVGRWGWCCSNKQKHLHDVKIYMGVSLSVSY